MRPRGILEHSLRKTPDVRLCVGCNCCPGRPQKHSGALDRLGTADADGSGVNARDIPERRRRSCECCWGTE